MGREEGIISLIGGFMRAKRARMEKLLVGHGVHPGQAPMLFAIFNEDGLAQKRLGEKMNLKPASITIMLRRLQKAGLIEKLPDERDQRVFRVFLTNKGETVKAVVKNAIEAVEKDACATLADEEIETLRKLIAKMKDSLDGASALERKQ
jgi:DNA-binding MarR family transcriptional regulator